MYFALVSVRYWPNLASIAHNEMRGILYVIYGAQFYCICAAQRVLCFRASLLSVVVAEHPCTSM